MQGQRTSQVPCPNCNKPFPADKIDLHQAFCVRYMRKCSVCSAFIDQREMDNHHQSQHAKAPCSWCKVDFPQHQMTPHQAQCPRRPVNCPFCETDFAFAESTQHQAVCGARTRSCQHCRQLILIRQLSNHERRCRQEERPVPSNQRPPNQGRVTLQRRIWPPEGRDRDASSNMIRGEPHKLGGGDRSLSSNRLHQKAVTRQKQGRYAKIIGPDPVKRQVDIVPICIRLTLNRNKEQQQGREPFRMRN